MNNENTFLFNFFTFIFITTNLQADEPSVWLKSEIDKILISYQNNDLPNENRFLMIEQTINNNFAGTGYCKICCWRNHGVKLAKKRKKNMLKILKDI